MDDARRNQRLDALKRANAMRVAKAQFKRDVASGDADPVRALCCKQLPDHLGKTQVWEYLSWVQFLGPIRARALVRDLGIAGTSLGSLSQKRREEVASRLRRWLEAQVKNGRREVPLAA